MGQQVDHLELLPNRSDVLVLVCYDSDGLVPTYTLVSASEYHRWEAQVPFAGLAVSLPPLPRQRKT